MKKRLISLLLAAALGCSTLVACSSKEDKDTSSSTASNSVTSTQNSGDNYKGPSGNTPVVNGVPDTSKEVTVKMIMLGDPPAGGADKRVFEKLNEKLKEKVNATLDVKWIEWNNYETKYQMALVSGEPVDLIFTSSTWLKLWDNAEKGSFMDMKEMLPHYAKNLWADTTAQEWEGCTYKGQIVALPEHRFKQLSTPVAVYRKDWSDEFGIGEIDSIDKLGQYFQAIKDKKPGVTPYDAAGSATSNEFYSLFLRQKTNYVLGPGTTGMFSAVASKSYDEPWKIASPIFDDWFMDFAKQMKQWGDAGYWPKDLMSTTRDTKTSMKANKSGIWQINVSNYYQFLKEIKKENPSAKTDLFFFDGAPRNLVVQDVVTQDACSIAANSENPERALMIYDLLQYDKDIYMLSQYGIEGQQYVIKDGKRARPEGYTDQKDSYAWDMWSTRNDKLSVPDVEDDLATIKAINDKMYPWAKPNPWGSFIFNPANVNAEMTAINEVCSKFGPAIQFGKAGDPVKAVTKFREELKNAGLDKYIAEVQKQCDEYVAQKK